MLLLLLLLLGGKPECHGYVHGGIITGSAGQSGHLGQVIVEGWSPPFAAAPTGCGIVSHTVRTSVAKQPAADSFCEHWPAFNNARPGDPTTFSSFPVDIFVASQLIAQAVEAWIAKRIPD